MRLIWLFAVSTIAMLTTPAAAQTGEAWPFGLENLKWEMSYEEVKAQLSGSIPEMMAPPGAPVTDQRGYFWGPLHWKDCVLELWTYFAEDKLDDIYIQPPQL